MIVRKALNFWTGEVARLALRVVAGISRGRPLSPSTLQSVARLGTGEDPLVRPWRRAKPGRMLEHPQLARELADEQLGTWALGPKAISYLQKEIIRWQPRLVLEFGSGISTVCLARFMVDLRGTDSELHVVSLDQSADFVRSTAELLDRCGLASTVAVIHAPLERQVVEGKPTICYAIPDSLGELLGPRKADFIVIDGPASEEGARFGTLPLARQFASPDARFVMDDGLRDGELSIAGEWRKLGYVELEGVQPIEKGLLTGWVHEVR